MADTGAQKYLKALEKKRKNEERSTGVRKGDAQVAAEQRKRAAKTEDSAARRSAFKPSAPKPAPKTGPTRDAPAYRTDKTKPSSQQGATRDAPAYRPGKKKDTSKNDPNTAALTAAMLGLGAAAGAVSKMANKRLTAPRPPTPPKPPVRIGNSVVPKNKLGDAKQYRVPKFPTYSQDKARDSARRTGGKPGGSGARRPSGPGLRGRLGGRRT
jgi:hypothetical protein